MSIFADETIHEFEHKGYTFGIKEITYGQATQINKKAMKFNFITKQPEIDLAVLQEEKIKAALVHIRDGEGNEVPVTLETIRQLKEDVANKLLEEVEALNEVSDQEKKS